MVSEEEARRQVAELIKKFEWGTDRQQSEADVRANYVDWLFSYLGWDVWRSDPQHKTAYQREAYVRGAGYVDVGLEILGQPRLFLEAKRFSVIPVSKERTGDRTLEEKQAFRYARGKKIPYAILTNFERLHLFNADHERLIFAFDAPQQYLDNFEELWRLSPGEVERGSLSWWEGQLAKKDVDLEFLAALRRWRLHLARAIYEHNGDNPALQRDSAFDFDRLMASVQRILDRLILVRYGDDKEVLLAHDLLEKMLAEYQGRGAYARPDHLMRAFIDLSHMMDEHHNTTLFAPGHICEQVTLPNEPLAQVMDEMNRISFRKFTSDILGNTYESYLGTKLTLRDGQIEDEERRDIRKGRGIYYTPRWVVEYIVDNTLDRRLKELEEEHGLHAIEKVRGLAVLDPACGSGSFLIYAYQVLADFYRRLNQAILDEQTKLVADLAAPDMFERLERLKHLPQPVLDYPQVILQEHLFGVDLDPEAAEIAAVNLTMQAFADSRQKKLPLILNENIKVGNSLISGSEEELRPYFGDAWREKRPFNWEQEFPDIMARSALSRRAEPVEAPSKGGGFDVVIGNPPYGASVNEAEASYFSASYQVVGGVNDVYTRFMERGLGLLRNGGVFSYIVPSAWIGGPEYARLRSLVLRHRVEAIVLLPFDVFPSAYVDTGIAVVSREAPGPNHIVRTYVFGKREELARIQLDEAQYKDVKQDDWQATEDYKFVLDPETVYLFHHLRGSCPRTLNDVALMKRGVLFDKSLLTDTRQSDQSHRYFEGDVYRYEINVAVNQWIEFGDKMKERPKEFFWFESDRILLRRLVNRRQQLMAALTTDTFITNKNLYTVRVRDDIVDIRVLLGVLNSRLLSFLYIRQVPQATKDDFPQVTIRDMLSLPFPSATATASHAPRLVALVERMLELHRRKGDSTLPQSEREDLEREIARTDREIDTLVYDLYGLTEEERRLVEDSP